MNPPQPPECQICGDPMVSDLVVCYRCDTPHHRECWKFNGKCSTFACGHTRFRGERPSRNRKKKFGKHCPLCLAPHRATRKKGLDDQANCKTCGKTFLLKDAFSRKGAQRLKRSRKVNLDVKSGEVVRESSHDIKEKPKPRMVPQNSHLPGCAPLPVSTSQKHVTGIRPCARVLMLFRFGRIGGWLLGFLLLGILCLNVLGAGTLNDSTLELCLFAIIPGALWLSLAILFFSLVRKIWRMEHNCPKCGEKRGRFRKPHDYYFACWNCDYEYLLEEISTE